MSDATEDVPLRSTGTSVRIRLLVRTTQVDVKPRWGKLLYPEKSRGEKTGPPFDLAASCRPNPEFDLIEVRTTTIDFIYNCVGPPSILKYKFLMRRHSETYNYGSGCQSSRNLAGFPLRRRPQSGEQISLGAPTSLKFKLLTSRGVVTR